MRVDCPRPCAGCPCLYPPAWVDVVFQFCPAQYMLNMDVGDIRNLMRKTQASILENGFLGKHIDGLKDVSVAL